MSTDTPKVDMPPYVIRLERENARLRDELSLANGTIESRDRNIATLQEELAEVIAQHQRADDRWMELGANYERELAEAKRSAIDYMEKWHKATHRADALQVTAELLPHAQAAIDGERQRAEQAESRALAAEKDKKQLLTRLVDALESAVDWAGYASEYFREKHQHQLDIDKLDAARNELAAIDAAIAGAKHE